MPLTNNKLDQVGPLARPVDDLALFDSALVTNGSLIALKLLQDVRMGISQGFLMTGLDPDVDRMSRVALEKLRTAGSTLVEAALPEPVHAAAQIARHQYEAMPTIANFLQDVVSGLSFEQMFTQASEGMQTVMNALVLPPGHPTRETYEMMLAQREQLKMAVRRYFEKLGLVAGLSANADPALKIDEDIEVDIGGRRVPLDVAALRQHGELVLPAGLTAAGLPIDMEFAGLSGTDREILALGPSLEKVLGPTPAPNLYRPSGRAYSKLPLT
jgi:mandelamide amidase